MDLLDGMVDLSQVELASENPEPYVLSWTVGRGVDGEAESSALALIKREEGVLLAVPAHFFSADELADANAGAPGILGPSALFQVPAVLLDGGVWSETLPWRWWWSTAQRKS